MWFCYLEEIEKAKSRQSLTILELNPFDCPYECQEEIHLLLDEDEIGTLHL